MLIRAYFESIFIRQDKISSWEYFDKQGKVRINDID